MATGDRGGWMGKHRFEALDGWRGLFATFVVLFHLNVVCHALDWRFVRHSWIFVEFFFVLSGFVIAGSVRKRRGAAEMRLFLIRRLARIWPLHVVMLGCFLLLEGAKLAMLHGGTIAADRAAFTGTTAPSAFASSFLLLQATPVWPLIAPNGPSWSISAEAWTYVIFAALAMVRPTRSGEPAARWPLAAGLAVASLVVLLATTRTLFQLEALAIVRCLYGFMIGVLTHEGWLRTRNRALPAATILELSYVALASGFVIYAVGTRAEYLAPLAFAPGILLFAREAGPVSRLLRTSPLQALGRYSFSIYMTHAFLRELMSRAFMLCDRRFGTRTVLAVPQPLQAGLNASHLIDLGPWAGDLLAVSFLLVTFLVSAATYKWVEVGGQKLPQRIAARLLAPRERRAAPQIEPVPL